MADIKIENILSNYKKLYSETSEKSVSEMDIFDNNEKLQTAAKKGKIALTNSGTVEVKNSDLMQELDKNNDKSLTLDEFKKYFKTNLFESIFKSFFKTTANEQIEELYQLISSLDGTEGVTADELEFVMSFDDDTKALTEKAVSNFIAAVKKEVENSSDTVEDTEAGKNTQEETRQDAAAKEVKQKEISARKEKYDGKIVENYAKLYGSNDSIGELNVLSDNSDYEYVLTRENAKKTNYDKLSSRGGNKDGEASAEEHFSYYGYDTDGTITLEQFKEFFKVKENDTRFDDLYKLISSLDGTEGLSADELQYVMDFNSDDKCLSEDDIKLFLEEVKKEMNNAGIKIQSQENTPQAAATDTAEEEEAVAEEAAEETVEEVVEESDDNPKDTQFSGKTVTIKSGDTPIGLMGQVEGAQNFSAQDYNALMEMNIKAGNIKASSVSMTDKQKTRYGVDYMLHPNQKLNLYTQEEIEQFKKTGELPEAKKEKQEEPEGTMSTLKDDDGTLQSFTYTKNSRSITLDGKSVTVVEFDEKGNEKYTTTIDISQNSSFKEASASDYPSGSDLANAIKSSDSSSIIEIGEYIFYDGVLYNKDGSKYIDMISELIIMNAK